jgi:hypothetical protein
VITTSVGLKQKALNVRRDPRVSLLFSDPTASGLADPPAVLVQGEVTSPDEVRTSPPASRSTDAGSSSASRKEVCTAPTHWRATCSTATT